MPRSEEIAKAMAEMDRFNQQPRATVVEERYEKRVASVGGSYGGLAELMSQGRPGNWASDHKAEAEKYSGWHYVAISAIGKAIRSCDVEAYQEPVREYSKAYNAEDDDSAPLPKWHPLMKILKRPSASQSGASFREEVAIQLCLTGSALIWNVPNQMGRTVERYIIPTAIAEPRQPEKGLPKGGWYINPEVARWQIENGWFLYTGLAQAIGKVIDARDVQVIRFIHPTFKDEGQSPVSAGALWTDTSEKIDVSRHAHLRNGSDPSVIIGIDGVEDESTLQRMSAKFNEKYAGPSKHGKAMFVNGQNVKVEPVTRTPAEMAYEGAFAQFRDAIMALHGVTPIAAGIEAPSGDDGLYAPLKQFIAGTVQPILDLMAEEDTEQLASQFGEGLTVFYAARSIDDAKLTEQQINTDIAAGAIEVDEIRKLRGRKPWGGEKGKAVAGQGPKQEGPGGLPGLNQGVPGLDAPQPPAGPQASAPGQPAQPAKTPEQIAEEAVAKALAAFEDRISGLLKSGSDCGTGAGGFKPGNSCAQGDGESSDKPNRGRKKRTESSAKKEVWEMSPDEYRKEENSRIVGAVKDSVAYTWNRGASRQVVEPDMLRVSKDGEIEILRREKGALLKDKPKWQKLPDAERESLAKKVQVGWTEDNRVWKQTTHEGEVERAISEGKPVPPEAYSSYPDLAQEMKYRTHENKERASQAGRGERGSIRFRDDLGLDNTEEIQSSMDAIAEDRDRNSMIGMLNNVDEGDHDKLAEYASLVDRKYGKWVRDQIDSYRKEEADRAARITAERERYQEEQARKDKKRSKKKSLAKSGSDCGANGPGGGGFQAGNSCASGDGAGASSGEVNSKVRDWAKKKFKDDKVAENFARWFGDSKVVDEDGNPLTVYHGTDAEFDEFKSRSGVHWFTDESDAAKTQGARVVAVYLAMKNPYMWGEGDKDDPEPDDDGFAERLKRLGHDGIIAPSNLGSIDYIVFSPTQIKSATNNSGAFSKRSNKFTKTAAGCGANAPGGGGFQPGNDCGGKRGGKKPKASQESTGPKIEVFERGTGDFKFTPNGELIRGMLGDIPLTQGEAGLIEKLSKKTKAGIESAMTDTELREDMEAGGINSINVEATNYYAKKTGRKGGWTAAYSNGALHINPKTAEVLEKETIPERKEGGLKRVISHEAGHGVWDRARDQDKKAFAEALKKNPELTNYVSRVVNVQAVANAFNDTGSRLVTESFAEVHALRRYNREKYDSLPEDIRNPVEAMREFGLMLTRGTRHLRQKPEGSAKSFSKTADGCGANAQGGGGFQPGNTCGKRDGSEGESQGGDARKVNAKVLAWAKEKFGDEKVAENFARWFGDSKVVDEDGNPLTVYHGTDAEFDEFKSRSGVHWFTDESDAAKTQGARVVAVYLAMKNPYMWGEGDKDDPEPDDDGFAERLKRLGHDGIIAPSNLGSIDYIVFSPTQIKSATNNSGAFSKRSNKFTKSADGCGANAQGGGGFQPGNTCARGGGGDSTGPKNVGDEIEISGGKYKVKQYEPKLKARAGYPSKAAFLEGPDGKEYILQQWKDGNWTLYLGYKALEKGGPDTWPMGDEAPKTRGKSSKAVKEFEDRISKHAKEVVLRGIEKETAGMIADSLERLYAERPDLPQLIAVKGTASRPIRDGVLGAMGTVGVGEDTRGTLYINSKLIGKDGSTERHMAETKDAIKVTREALEKGTIRSETLRAKAAKLMSFELSGSPDKHGVKAVIEHELGHFIEKVYLMKEPERRSKLLEGYKQKAKNVSAYASESEGEYIAEVYAFHRMGEVVDSGFSEWFKELGL